MNSQIEQFAACVYQPADCAEIRAIRQGEARKFWTPACKLIEHAERLGPLNQEGFDIYVAPNPRRTSGQSGDDSVLLCRCLFADFDRIEPAGQFSPADIVSGRISETSLPKPTILLNSGHGVHAYWRLSDPLEPGQWRRLQERLNKTLGSDEAIKNPERLMRLPGFRNLKDPPADCCIIEADSARVYGLSQIVVHLAKLPKTKPEPRAAASTGKRPEQLEIKGRAALYASRWAGVVEGEGRNRAAFKHSCQLRVDFDLNDIDAWSILSDWNQKNNPPLSDIELRSAFQSAAKYSKGEPGKKLNEQRKTRNNIENQEQIPDGLTVFDQYIGDVEAGRLKTIDWPWFFLTDGTQALQPGTLTIVSGGPGAAKSLFMLQAIRFWLSHDVSVCYFGMERDRIHYLCRCLAQLTGRAEVTRQDFVRDNADAVRGMKKEHAEEFARFNDCLRTKAELKAEYLGQIARWVREQSKAGARIVCIDPITLALRSGKAWEADARFVQEVNGIVQEFGNNCCLVTHPEKAFGEEPTLYNIAGGASYNRNSDNVFTVRLHETTVEKIKSRMGTCECEFNQTIGIAKSRGGELDRKRLAFEFDRSSLTMKEVGVIIPR